VLDPVCTDQWAGALVRTGDPYAGSILKTASWLVWMVRSDKYCNDAASPYYDTETSILPSNSYEIRIRSN
jgi:hypothetical protein